MKRVVFDLNFNGRVVLNRANIVGFREPDPTIIFTTVLLDSGAEVSLHGMRIDEAEKVLADFDAALQPEQTTGDE